MTKELSEGQIKQALIEFKEDNPHYLEEELGCFEDAVKIGFELGKEAGQNKTVPFAYVIDDGFRQQITVVISEDTKLMAKRFGWNVFPLYAGEPLPPTPDKGEE